MKMNISELRKEKGFSQKELADMLGVAQNTISNWETGTREPDLKTILELCKIFGTSLDAILGDPSLLDKTEEEIAVYKEQSKKIKAFNDFVDLLSAEDLDRVIEMSKIMFPNWQKDFITDMGEDFKDFTAIDLSPLTQNNLAETKKPRDA